MTAPLTALRTLLTGHEPRQQLRATQALLGLAIYGVFGVLLHLAVWFGLAPSNPAWGQTIWTLIGGTLFYALIRSGWNERLRRDRALTVPQQLWGLVAMAWGYAIMGPARGTLLVIMMLILMFGMFSLTPRKAAFIAAAGFAMLGSVMVWKAMTDPGRYDPHIEAMHFSVAGCAVAWAVVLTSRVGRMRERLERQRADLTDALQRIQAMATRDELTGLLNRRAVLGLLQVELRARGPLLCVALIDLDHFKRVNDGHGHAAGDLVLRRFADLAATVVRSGDVLARWGGEEFLLMMPGSDAEQAMCCLERIRELLNRNPVQQLDPPLVVRFSAGVAECAGDANLEAAIERADAAMYRAKVAGRDRALRAA